MLAAAILACQPEIGSAQALPSGDLSLDGARELVLSPAELFRLADDARDSGDFATAQTAYRALATNPDIELRTEARFRLALMLADQMEQYEDAAVLLRQILDEKPDAARVRVELARMQANLGNFESARRELRAAQAAGLPPQVEQLVRFYASALAARKRVGGSFQLAIAPDSNINRATQSGTLETIIGEFDLSDDAQATSGIGLSMRGQGYYRLPVGQSADILVRANGAARFFRKDEFNDYIASLHVGPQITWGGERLSLSAMVSHRWFGNDAYTFAYGASANWQRPLSETARFTLDELFHAKLDSGDGSILGRFYGDAAQEYVSTFAIEDAALGSLDGVSFGTLDP